MTAAIRCAVFVAAVLLCRTAGEAVSDSSFECSWVEAGGCEEDGGEKTVLLQTALAHHEDSASELHHEDSIAELKLVDKLVDQSADRGFLLHTPSVLLFTVMSFLLLLVVIYGVHQAVSAPSSERMLALDGVRFMMVAIVVLSRVLEALPKGVIPSSLRLISSRFTWGISAFFMLAGFTSAVQLTPLLKDPRFSDSKFMLQRVMRIYPTYLLSLVLMLAILPWEKATEKPYLSVMVPGVSAWVEWATVNPLNSMAWCVGPLLLNSCLAPALLRLVHTSSVETRWGTLMPFAYCVTLWAAWSQSGHIFSAIDPINKVLFWVPHVPEFFIGLVMGTCFLERDHKDTPAFPTGLVTELFNAAGASACLATLVLIACSSPALDAKSSYWPLVLRWGEHGLLLPLIGAFFWQLASPDCYDPLKRALSWQPVVALGKLSFAAYMLQQLVHTALLSTALPAAVTSALPSVYFDSRSMWQLAPQAWALLAIAFAVHHLLERPLWRMSAWALLPDLTAPDPALARTVAKGWPEIPLSFKLTRAVLYYAFFFGHIIGVHFLVTHVFETKGECSTLLTLKDTVFQGPYNCLLWFLMVAYAPGMLLNTFGHMLYPAFVHKDIPLALGAPDDAPHFPDGAISPWRMHFRWVTRGDNPHLVSSTIRETHMLLQGMNMNPETYVLEVVTDNAINCAQLSGVPVNEIVVPGSYTSSTSTKFKARALNYAIFNSSANNCDWIIHLDEETKISERVVAQLWAHCAKEHFAVQSGVKEYGNIGQGAILYGTGQHGEICNWVTTLADTGRVGDDFGKFRIQFENGATVIGMHGSFIAISQQVEELVTYDHGHAGSICEDLYFALYAYGHHSVKFSWVDGFMYEQSPFSMMDLVKQRQRWFSGMFLVCFSSGIPKLQRAFLMLCCFSWNLVPMMALITLIMTFIEGGESYALWRTVSSFNALMMQSYLIGFVVTYSMSEGVMRYLVLFMMQLNGAPIFGILEAMGAFRAMTRSEAYLGFHVIQKELGGKSSTGLPTAKSEGALTNLPHSESSDCITDRITESLKDSSTSCSEVGDDTGVTA